MRRWFSVAQVAKVLLRVATLMTLVGVDWLVYSLLDDTTVDLPGAPEPATTLSRLGQWLTWPFAMLAETPASLASSKAGGRP